ncbi:unnamed protein product [Macrosiphum euphorbiae]|uniref:Uncharacterized protein n=1 Tax=Macrosiphum euphorbiae TaxID=13131 RepID=A0AAV0W4P8_9HEMI|nr:unnamed protein product [Macrosiphum euphorbiae]
MSNITEVTIESSEVEIITPSAESNENCREISSERSGQFPALRRHSSIPNTAVQTASSGDAWDCRQSLPRCRSR